MRTQPRYALIQHGALILLSALLLGGCARTVPDVVGLDEAAAEAAIIAAGLEVGMVLVEGSDSVAAGLVISQRPAAGDAVEAGSFVSLTISGGPTAFFPEMLSVTGGLFEMGKAGFATPIHDVTLSAYEIATYELTNAEFATVMNWALDQGYIDGSSSTITYNEQELLDVDGMWCQIAYEDGEYVVRSRDNCSMADHPVIEVSWYGAVAYCNWLSEARDLTPCYDLSTWALVDPDAGGYRLPTEAEWEYAAGWDAATSSQWAYANASDTLDTTQANYDQDNPLGLSATPYTTPIGYYDTQTSPVGCYDMSGNVTELVHDWYDDAYYTQCSNGVTDPLGPATGTDDMKVGRGGSWYSSSVSSCLSGRRSGQYVHLTNLYLGFRLAR